MLYKDILVADQVFVIIRISFMDFQGYIQVYLFVLIIRTGFLIKFIK